MNSSGMSFRMNADNISAKRGIYMRILMINTVPTEKNGITNVIMNLVSSIPDKNMHFDLLSINEPNQEYQDIIHSRGGKIYVIERRIRHVFRYMMRLKKIIQKNKYDIVHIHANSRLCVLDLIGTIMGGCKVRIVHSHNTTCAHKRLHRILTPAFKLLCTGCLACSNEAGRWMFGDMNYKIIPNGILAEKWAFDESARKIIRKKYQLENRVVLGNMAGFVEQKNQTFLIDILGELLKTNHQYALLLMGDGQTRPSIEEKVKILGLNNAVVFTGTVCDGVHFLSACDLFIMPSLYEGFPLALIEAQACGLNCIVSDKITKSTNLTGNLTFLSLDEPIEVWASECINSLTPEQNRMEKSNSAIESISDRGYNIKASVKELVSSYKMVTFSNEEL